MSKPVRLHKVEDNSHHVLNIDIEAWAMAHANLLLPIILVLFILVFVLIAYSIVGICAVESGGMRNFINGGI